MLFTQPRLNKTCACRVVPNDHPNYTIRCPTRVLSKGGKKIAFSIFLSLVNVHISTLKQASLPKRKLEFRVSSKLRVLETPALQWQILSAGYHVAGAEDDGLLDKEPAFEAFGVEGPSGGIVETMPTRSNNP